MAKLDDVLGPGDEDVMNFRAGVNGLAFMGWADEQIAEVAVEEARKFRSELNAQLAGKGLKPAFPDVTE